MKEVIKNILSKYGPPFLFCKKSYAQEGEDLVVDRLLEGKKNGFYVEVGAHHPFRFSNTFFFYKRGWSGICIDPLPGTKSLFRKNRPRDIAIELGVSKVRGQLEYLMFNEPALNTFDTSLASARDGVANYRITKKVLIETMPLSEILKGQKIPTTGIDLMSVDVEGLDLQVLESNDWEVFRPKVIIAEALSARIEDIASDPIYRFLEKHGYSLYAKTGCSIIFKVSEK